MTLEELQRLIDRRIDERLVLLLGEFEIDEAELEATRSVGENLLTAICGHHRGLNHRLNS
jgi:hypothetical protein